MAKTQEELYTLKQELESLTNKLKKLTDDELGYVVGGDIGKTVDPERTTCIWGYSDTRFNNYFPIDSNLPQKCGNCKFYHSGICTAGKG